MDFNDQSVKLFFSTVKIDNIIDEKSHSTGTGFIFSHKIDKDKTISFLVTNKHVINNNTNGEIKFHLKENNKPVLGKTHTVNFNKTEWDTMWHDHPKDNIDVTITELDPIIQKAKKEVGKDIFYEPFYSTKIPDENQIQDLTALEEVTFIGYPNGIYDKANYLPIARKGTTATPLQIDYKGEPKFLIDASVFGGSSGSPVFILNQNSYPTKHTQNANVRFYFLGIVASVYYKTDENELIAKSIPTQTKLITEQHEMLDLGVVFKAKTIIETIEEFINKHQIT